MNKSTLRIVHIADFVMPAVGYQEFLLPKWNARHGHEAYILCADRYAPIPNYEEVWAKTLGSRICGAGTTLIENVIVERLPTVEIMRRPWLFGLERRIREIDPDVIWVHGTASPSAFRMAFMCKKLSKPLLMDNHQCFIAARGGWVGKSYYSLLRTVSRWFLANRVQQFIGVAQECCDFMAIAQGLPAQRIALLSLGVDTDIFKRSPELREIHRMQMGIPSDAVVVLQTGKLDSTRRPDWLAQAMVPLMKSYANLWLLYVGGGSKSDLDSLRRIIGKADLERRVIFHPFVLQHKLPNFFNVADICVYPDSSSLSCLEAGACECAVIVNDLPASRERAEAGVGISYRRGDIKQLQAIIKELIDNHQWRTELGHKSREYVLHNLSYDRIAKQAEDMMKEAIALSCGSASSRQTNKNKR